MKSKQYRVVIDACDGVHELVNYIDNVDEAIELAARYDTEYDDAVIWHDFDPDTAPMFWRVYYTDNSGKRACHGNYVTLAQAQKCRTDMTWAPQGSTEIVYMHFGSSNSRSMFNEWHLAYEQECIAYNLANKSKLMSQDVLREIVEQHVDEIFCVLVEDLNIKTGDIDPCQVIRLESVYVLLTAIFSEWIAQNQDSES